MVVARVAACWIMTTYKLVPGDSQEEKRIASSFISHPHSQWVDHTVTLSMRQQQLFSKDSSSKTE